MKITNVLDTLTPKERLALARWYDTDAHMAFRKLIDIERVELAKDHVDKTDILEIRYLSGQAHSLKKLVQTIQRNYTEMDKDKVKKAKG